MTTNTAPLRVSDSITRLLGVLHGGLPGHGWGLVGRGTAGEAFRWSPGDGEIWPARLVQELSYDTPPDVQLCPATLDAHGSSPVATRCVWAEIAQPPVFDKRGWYIPEAVIAEARARLEAFPLPASLVLDQAWSWWVAWLLDSPAALSSAPTRRRVELLQRAIAERVGGRVDDEITVTPTRCVRTPGQAVATETQHAWSLTRRVLRVPGSRNHERGSSGMPRRGGAPVRLLHLDESRYKLEIIETALANGAKKGKR